MDFSVIRRKGPPKKPSQPHQGEPPSPPKKSSQQHQGKPPLPQPHHPPPSHTTPAPHVEESDRITRMQRMRNPEHMNTAGTLGTNYDDNFEYFLHPRREHSYHLDPWHQMFPRPEYHHTLLHPPHMQDQGHYYYHDHDHQHQTLPPLEYRHACSNPPPNHYRAHSHYHNHQHQTPPEYHGALPNSLSNEDQGHSCHHDHPHQMHPPQEYICALSNPPNKHDEGHKHQHDQMQHHHVRSNSQPNQDRGHSYYHDDEQHQMLAEPPQQRLSLPPLENHRALSNPQPTRGLPPYDPPQYFYYAREPETCYINPELGRYSLEEDPNHCHIL